MAKNVKSLATYKTLYNLGFSAAGQLEARALETSDLQQKKALRAKATEIIDYMLEHRRAQIVALTAPATGQSSSAGDRLRKAVKGAEKDLKDLEALSKALKTATKLLKAVKKLFVLL